MKNKLIGIAILFILFLTAFTIITHLKWNSFSEEEDIRDQIVALNEIEQLSEELVEASDEAVRNELKAVIQELQEELRASTVGNHMVEAKKLVWYMYAVCIIFLLFVLGYVFYFILRPFDKLKDFAEEVARGNFDSKLNYERTNFFGAFTWAFDHMRREITKARSGEKEAIDNNKTVIATLSHDIKTPIASIRAYAEGLDANLDSTADRRRRYLSVIMNKCDEVTKLTDDLFLHSLADLDKLKMHPEPVEIRDVLNRTVAELSMNSEDIIIKGEILSSMVLLDEKRFIQVMENLINNSRKYAQSKIEISTKIQEKDYIITLHDYGEGILDEDMPFIFNKFYRGKNAGEQQGSGLGLYICKYICEQMKGNITLHNDAQGLEAVINFPVSQENLLKIS